MTILRHPNKNQLQQLVVAAGLLQNFAALDALANQGIVQGHMRLHITNLIAELGITDQARVDQLRSQMTAHLRQHGRISLSDARRLLAQPSDMAEH